MNRLMSCAVSISILFSINLDTDAPMTLTRSVDIGPLGDRCFVPMLDTCFARGLLDQRVPNEGKERIISIERMSL
jgi:hypothetical protein